MRLDKTGIGVILTLACAMAASACEADPDRRRSAAPPAPADSPAAAPAAASADTALSAAAERIIAFLRGDAPFDPSLFADSVTLRIAPEGGGGSRTVARARLAERDAWTIGGHRLAPPERATELTTAVGRHFNCYEVPLSTRYEELAALPHVGARLAPEAMESCLQAWNLTLVFAPDTERPELVTAVYDQWEW